VRKGDSTASIMRQVMYASLPGLAAMLWFFGWGHAITLAWACLSAVAIEALVLLLRRRSLRILEDCSALLTGWLLGLALPAFSPWWLTLIAVAFAILAGKQLFGGLGSNPFNPAMLGYAFVLVMFPVAFAVQGLSPGSSGAGSMDLATAWDLILYPASSGADAVTSATVLAAFQARGGLTVAEFVAASPALGAFGSLGWEWVNLGFLAGGLWLLHRRIFTWHAPLGMLAGLGLGAALYYDAGSSASLGSPLMHWFSGAAMLGAFFIITDPVSSAVLPRDRLLIGLGAGFAVFAIRSWGRYPDGVAFAVLLANLWACWSNRLARPPVPATGRTGSPGSPGSDSS